MSHQTTMFEQSTDAYGNVNVVSTKPEPPIVRSTDRMSSRIAAVRLRLSNKRRNAAEDFAYGVALCGGQATAREAAKAASDNEVRRDTIRKRPKDCIAAGWIRELPEKDNRACIVTGEWVTVYEIV